MYREHSPNVMPVCIFARLASSTISQLSEHKMENKDKEFFLAKKKKKGH